MSERMEVQSSVELGRDRERLTPSLVIKRDLKMYAQRVDPYLDEVFSAASDELGDVPASTRQMLQYLREFCLQGGKRLRPYLVASGYQLLAKQEPDEVVVRASVLPELIHAFLLIHDDIIDESEMRRGQLTIHKRYEQEQVVGHNGRLNHFGESMGILAGDLMYAITWQALNQLVIKDKVKVQLMNMLNQTIMQTIAGQELDIRLELQAKPTVDEVLAMYKLKTANYSLGTPLKMGVMLAGATDEAVVVLAEYAAHCGVAFQIQDDVLGLYGDEKKTGKSAVDDLVQGKRTVLVAKALELVDQKQALVLKEVLGNETVTEEMVESVRLIVQETGALCYCENMAQEYVVKAKLALQKLTDDKYDQVVRERLSDVADFVVQRGG